MVVVSGSSAAVTPAGFTGAAGAQMLVFFGSSRGVAGRCGLAASSAWSACSLVAASFFVVCGGVNMERLGVNYHVLWVACCVVWRAVAGAVMTRNLSVGLQACYLYVQGVSGHSG